MKNLWQRRVSIISFIPEQMRSDTDEGIVEEGNHEELMAEKGVYYQFYTRANAIR